MGYDMIWQPFKEMKYIQENQKFNSILISNRDFKGQNCYYIRQN